MWFLCCAAENLRRTKGATLNCTQRAGMASSPQGNAGGGGGDGEKPVNPSRTFGGRIFPAEGPTGEPMLVRIAMPVPGQSGRSQ